MGTSFYFIEVLNMGIAVLGLVSEKVDPYWSDIGRGVRSSAKKYKVDANYFSPPEAGITGPAEDAITSWQRATIEELISKEIKAIAFAPLNPQPLVPLIKKAIDLGIPCITYDLDAAETGRYFYVGTNNYLAGKIACNTLATLIGFKGEIVIDTPSLIAQSCTERIKGFKETIIRYPNIRIVEVVSGEEDPAKIISVATRTLSTYKNLSGIFCVAGVSSAANARGVKMKIKEDKIKIVSFDAIPEVIEFIRQGIINATIAQRPYTIGYRVVEFLYQMINYGVDGVLRSIPPSRIIDTGVDIITRENLEEYLSSQIDCKDL